MNYTDDSMTVKVNVEQLRKILKRNRRHHEENFEAAWKVYEKAVVEAMEANLKAAKEGKSWRLSINLLTPEDHTSDYGRVIGMLGMATEKIIKLTSHDYERFVLDHWEWEMTFETNTMAYLAS